MRKESDSAIKIIVAKRLQAARKKSGLSMREVAIKLSLTTGFLSQLENENHKTMCSVYSLIAFADLYKVSTDWLLGKSEL